MFNSHGIRPRLEARCDYDFARCTGLCSAFDSKAMRDFSQRSHRETYLSGTEIAVQGEFARRIGVIASGLVKIVVLTEGGDEHVLQILRPGHLIGHPEREENAFSCAAVTETAICWMPRETWHVFLQSHPQICRSYLSALNRQFEEMQLSVIKMRGRSAVQRLAYWMLEEALEATGGSMPHIRIVLTRRDLASLLNMTAETLCRALRQLEERGAIHLLAPDRLKITDAELLRRLAKYQDERIGAAPTEPDCAPRLSQRAACSEGEKASIARLTGVKMATAGKRLSEARGSTATPSRRD